MNAQCNINATAVFSACPVGTGCSWTDPIWACGSFPNGAAVTANIGEPGLLLFDYCYIHITLIDISYSS